jgi:hypothetical protein
VPGPAPAPGAPLGGEVELVLGVVYVAGAVLDQNAEHFVS